MTLTDQTGAHERAQLLDYLTATDGASVEVSVLPASLTPTVFA